MKRLLFLTLISLLLITACSAPTDEPVTEDPAPITEPDSPAEEPTPPPAEPTPQPADPTDQLALSLQDAGLSEADVTLLLDRQVSEGPRDVRIIKFLHDDTVYFYKYLDDRLLDRERYPASAQATTPDGGIEPDQAKQIALDSAGLSEADITDYDIEVDVEDNRLIYQIDFEAGSLEYEYEIDFYSGDILKEEIDD